MLEDCMDPSVFPLDNESVFNLVRRDNLWPRLIRRQEEEFIAELVPIESEWIESQRESFLGDRTLEDVLREKHWDDFDLNLHLRLPEALKRFGNCPFRTRLRGRIFICKGWA